MNKFLKYTLVALPIIVGGYIVFKQLKKKKKEEAPTPPTPSPTTTGGGKVIKVRDTFPLKKGSKGEKVRELQRYILQKDKNALPRFGADGDFGNETEGALMMLYGKTQVNSQAELDEIKSKSLPKYTKGAPLVFRYDNPDVVSPFLNIPK